jgi:hypothetical protein
VSDDIAYLAKTIAKCGKVKSIRDTVEHTDHRHRRQFRSLNQTMWQVPVMAMTLTGGLWFASGAIRGMDVVRAPLFLLATIFDVAFVFVLIRIRYVMGEYLKKISAFHPQGFTEARGNNWYNRSMMVAWAFSLALALSALASLVGAFYFGFQTRQESCAWM